ncbi:MAG: hypothetical protein ACRC8Y_22735 [Chroococcales cyanobacterium]
MERSGLKIDEWIYGVVRVRMRCDRQTRAFLQWRSASRPVHLPANG